MDGADQESVVTNGTQKLKHELVRRRSLKDLVFKQGLGDARKILSIQLRSLSDLAKKNTK